MNEPIRRRKAESVIRDLHRAAEQPKMEERSQFLSDLAWNAKGFRVEFLAKPDLLAGLIGGLRAVRNTGGIGAQTAERELMESLAYWTGIVANTLEDAGVPRMRAEAVKDAPAKHRPLYQVLGVLSAYATDCLQYRRPRDAYGGERRASALTILGSVNRQVEVPGFMDMLIESLSRPASAEARGVVMFLHDHGLDLADSFTEELKGRLLRVAEEARSKGWAAGALKVLVEAGMIGESEALGRLDDWEQKRWR